VTASPVPIRNTAQMPEIGGAEGSGAVPIEVNSCPQKCSATEQFPTACDCLAFFTIRLS
jgi:hypothetical protein